MSTKNCQDCFQIQAALDIANVPQAGEEHPTRWQSPLATEALKKVRKILNG